MGMVMGRLIVKIPCHSERSEEPLNCANKAADDAMSEYPSLRSSMKMFLIFKLLSNTTTPA